MTTFSLSRMLQATKAFSLKAISGPCEVILQMNEFVPIVFDLLKKKQINRDVARVLLDAAQNIPQATGIEKQDRRIAIIGIAAEFPGAKTFEEFWHILEHSEDHVSELSPARQELCTEFVRLHGDSLGIDQTKPFWNAAWIEDIDKFDPAFFNIAPAEARVIDPQQRRFLQTAYQCFEDAGYAGSRIRDSKTGVYVSAAMVNYADALSELSPYSVPGNIPSFVASRVSYTFNLRGPSYVSSSTCASSLVALHEACLGLLNGDCDQALVGGVNIFPFPINTPKIFMNAAGIMSDEQRCRPFDNQADGIGRGEGIVALLLKPLTQALQDRDNIHGVILGSAINNDGASAGITAPNPRAHTELLLDAWNRAGITPEMLSYIEAHGTGTRLGDPIEIRGITDAVHKFTNRRQFIALGSVKGNIGHLLDGVAGLSGLVKVVHILKRGVVPPTKHLEEPNRHIDFLDSPVFVPTFPWPLSHTKQEPLRAAVSCFGFNGTNVHVVLEEATIPQQQAQAEAAFVFPLSARTITSLRALVAKYAHLTENFFAQQPDNIAYTLWSGREHLEQRVAITASNTREFIQTCQQLHQTDPEHWHTIETVYVNTNLSSTMDRQIEQSNIAILAQAYIANEQCLWHRLFEGKEVYKVALPTYTFDEQSYWITVKAESSSVTKTDQASGTQLEKVLSIARSVLEIETLTEHNNFLECGGNSLIGLQLISRLRKEFQSTITHEDLLTLPNFQSIAEKITQGIPSASISIQKNKPEQRYPLSFAQQRFWFLSHLETEHSFYNIPLIARLTGELDLQALEKSLAEIERRHENLRSSYPLDDQGMPYITIHPVQPFSLSIIDLQHTPIGEHEQQALQIVKDEMNRPFDLEHGPIWRTCVLRLDKEVTLFLVVMHHIITDIWSFKNFVQELTTLYEAYHQGRPSPLPELSIQYTDFSIWQRHTLNGDALEALTRYWRQQLDSYHTLLELPTDRPRGAIRTLEGKTLPVSLPASLEDKVKELCKTEGVTSFMLLLAVFNILLYKYTGQEDIIVGTEVANRTQVETEHLIGAFVNQLALRTSLTGNPTFRKFLERIRKTTLEAYAHQEMPFDKLVEVLKPERRANATPFFTVKFLFDNISKDDQSLSGLVSEAVDIPSDISPFDLTLRIAEENGAQERVILTGSLTYNTDLFEERTMLRLLNHFQVVLDQVLQHPDIHLSQLEITTQEEKERKMKEQKQQEDLKQKSLKNFSRRAAPASMKSMVKTSFLKAGDHFPLVLEPTLADIDLADWLRNNRAFIETKLLEHGAILFHNFQIASVAQFQQISTAIHPQLVEYSEPSTPRGEYMDKVYVSSEYPNYYSIPLHSELCYTYQWPMKALFYSKVAALKGGETPIADAREVLKRIDPRVREKFIEKQVMYLRNYGDGLLVPWEKVFRTSDRATVEKHCRDNAPMWCEWSGENHLRTRQIRPAIATHPVTGDPVWFNQAHIFHIYSLGGDMQEKLLTQFGEENLPVHALYGDGTPIANWELDEIYKAYRECAYAFPWQEGDLLLADNMLMAHGRNSFEGPRETVVSFVEPCPVQRKKSAA